MQFWSVCALLFWMGLATCWCADYQFSQKLLRYKLRKYVQKTETQENLKTKPVKEDVCGYAVSFWQEFDIIKVFGYVKILDE